MLVMLCVAVVVVAVDVDIVAGFVVVLPGSARMDYSTSNAALQSLLGDASKATLLRNAPP